MYGFPFLNLKQVKTSFGYKLFTTNLSVYPLFGITTSSKKRVRKCELYSVFWDQKVWDSSV